MAYSRKDVEKTKMNAKKFVRYQEGAEKYSILLVTKAHALPTLCLNTLLIRKREKLNVGSLNLRFPKPLILSASTQ